MNSSPGIPTDMGTIVNQASPETAALDAQLNSVEVYGYVPLVRRANRIGTTEPMYNLGYVQPPIRQVVTHLPQHYEAPEVQRSPIAYAQSILNSMKSQKQVVGRTPTKLRAPAIGEGL